MLYNCTRLTFLQNLRTNEINASLSSKKNKLSTNKKKRNFVLIQNDEHFSDFVVFAYKIAYEVLWRIAHVTDKIFGCQSHRKRTRFFAFAILRCCDKYNNKKSVYLR